MNRVPSSVTAAPCPAGIDGSRHTRESQTVVIVVDESRERRAAIGTVLRADGHHVVEVSDAAQLLSRLMCAVALRRHPEPVAVVADPRASVCAVLEMLRAARWRLPLVLVTGGDERPPASELGALATFRVPVDLRALRRTVAAALEPPRMAPST